MNETMTADELIFVVLEHDDGGKVAFESNYQLVVFGSMIDELTNNILAEVENYFKGKFNGGIRIREFKDTIVKMPLLS